MTDGPEWFAPKRYGIGSGLPIAWQGWLVLGVYLAVAIGASILVIERPLLVGAIIFAATVLLLLVTARTTRGGWRWRWGKED